MNSRDTLQKLTEILVIDAAKQSKRTLGQVAFEADRENAMRGKMRVLIPTWSELPKMMQENWEVMALRIAEAIVKEMPEALQDLSRDVIEIESREETKCLPLLTSS